MISYSIPCNYIPKRNSLVERGTGKFVRVTLGQKAFYPSLILPLIICLAMPESVHPNVVVLPFAVLFGFSVRVMASTFKKYL
jgi:hypothetical protein